MSNKNLMTILIVAVLSIMNVSAKNILSLYDSHKKVYSSKTLNTHYVGPLFATGGAMSGDVNRMISEMAPENIGSFSSNSLTLIESAPRENQVYTFKKVKCYSVTQDSTTFNILHIKSKIGSEKYDIIVEMKKGPNYDRTITIYKDGKPLTLILWLDNSKITQKKNNSEI
jgi:hypothetical protein